MIEGVDLVVGHRERPVAPRPRTRLGERRCPLHLGPPEPFEVARVWGSGDRHGFPALGFEIADSERERFENWTASIVGSQLAIVIDGQVVTAPMIDEPIPGHGIIHGGAFGFADDEVRALIEAMDR